MTVNVTQQLLERIDAAARRNRVTRSTWVRWVLSDGLPDDLKYRPVDTVTPDGQGR